MPTAATIFWGFITPALLVAAVLLAVRKTWVIGPAISAAFAIAFWNLQGPATFPPTNAVQWIFWFTILLAILSSLDSLLHPPLWLRTILLLLFWRIVMHTLIARLVPHSLLPRDAEISIDAASLIVLVWWLTIESIAARTQRHCTPVVLSILSFGVGSFIFTTLHIQREGMVGMSVAAMCATIAAIAWWKPNITLARGGAETVVLILLMLMAFAWFYTNDTLTTAQNWRAAVLLSAPLLAFKGDVPWINRMRPGIRLAARLLAVGLVVGAVAALCVQDYVAAERASAAAAGEI